MSKPTTKQGLIEAAQTERTALEKSLVSLMPEEITRPGTIGDWSIKDVLSHLIEWEQMVINWYETGLKGQVPAVPSEEYNWAQLPQLNHVIYLKYCDTPLGEVMKSFGSSYRKIMKVIEGIPEKELFTSRVYPWTRNNALASYFVSGTSSHYRWARTVIRRADMKPKKSNR